MKSKVHFRKVGAFPCPIDSDLAKTLGIEIYERRGFEWLRENYEFAMLDDAWIEASIAKGWMVAYRMIIQGDVPVIAELRVFPAESGREQYRPGQWSGEFLGMKATVPEGGIKARLVRKIKPGEHYRSTQDFLQWAKERDWEPLGALPSIVPTRRGRKRNDDRFYARFARDYAKLQRGSKTPAKALAEKHNIAHGQARTIIHQCRKRNLLTPAKQSRPGGLLTPYAEQLLEKKVV